MTNQSVSYAAVIADLKRKRDKLDQAIRALEELSGTSEAPEGPVEETVPDSGGPAEGTFLGMPIPNATKTLLRTKKKPLTNAEIVGALESGGLILSSENKTNTVGSILNRRSRQVGDIVSPKRGQWGLKEWYPGRNFGRKDNGEQPAKPSEAGDDSDLQETIEP